MNRRTGVFALVFAALVFGVSIFQIRSPDLYWHIKMGSDWIFKGLSPFVDHYSYTMPGKPIGYVPWGFQVGIALLYSAFGFAGVGIFRFVAFSLALILVDRSATRLGASGSVRVLVLGICLASFVMHSEPRPDLASLTFEALFVVLFLRWRETRSFRQLVLPLILLVAWINVHPTGVIGLVIALAFFADAGIDEILKGRYRRLVIPVGCAALFAAASFLHHELSSPLPTMIRFNSRWAGIIEEFGARDFAVYEFPLRMYWALMALSLPALFIRRYWAGVLLVLVTGYQGFQTYKFTPHMLMMTSPFVAAGLQYYWEQIRANGNANAQRLVTGGVAAGAAAVMLFNGYWIYARPILPLNMEEERGFFPGGLVKYMKDTGVRGRVFNHYDWGAYLFFHFDQDLKVFIDQRTNILYDINVFNEWLRIATVPAEMKKAAARYQIDYVVTRPDQVIVNEPAIESGLFGLQYMDDHAALYVRGKGRFPETQRYLYSPRCLDDEAIRKSLAEYRAAGATLPADSILIQYWQLLDGRTAVSSSSVVARLASERAYRAGNKEASLGYLSGMAFTGIDDQIAVGKLLIELGRFDTALVILSAESHGSRLRDDQKTRIADLMYAAGNHQSKVVDAAAKDHCEFLARISP